MKYKNFVFDFYGTLVDVFTDDDSEQTNEKMAAFFTERGAMYTPEEYKENFHRCLKRQQKERENCIYAPTGEAVRFPEVDVLSIYEELFAVKNISLQKNYALQSARYYREISTVRLALYPGVQEFFDQLRREERGIYLLSNAQREYTLRDLEKVGLLMLFDGVLLSSDYGCRKPDPIFFGELTRQFGVLPQESLMIGNDRSSDIYGANLFGMDSVLFVSSQELAAPLDGVESTYMIKSGTYREFLELLPELLSL